MIGHLPPFLIYDPMVFFLKETMPKEGKNVARCLTTPCIESINTQFYSQVILYNQLSINLVYCFFSKWYSKLIKQIHVTSRNCSDSLLFVNKCNTRHGVISMPIGPLASVTLLKISNTFPSHWKSPLILRIFGYLTLLLTFLLEGPAALFSSFFLSPNFWR